MLDEMGGNFNFDNDTENIFIEKLIKQLNKKEVLLPDGNMVTNLEAIIDGLIGKAIDGDVTICKLIRDLLNNK